jgi:hypothetical protein
VASLTLAGCAESIYLSSRPQGADVTINGAPVGRTPLTYSVRPSDWNPPYNYRVERKGYEPAKGTLATGVSEGSIIGGIFTLGLSLLFKQPGTFVEQEHVFDLESAPTTGEAPKKTEGRPRREPRPPAVPYEPPSDQGIYRYEHPAAPTPSPVPQPTPTRVRKPSPSPQGGEKPRPTSSPKPKPRPSPNAVSPPPPPPPPPRSSAPPPPPAAAPPPSAAAKPSVQEELDRLRRLRDEGVIVDAEYEQLRESVLKGQ